MQFCISVYLKSVSASVRYDYRVHVVSFLFIFCLFSPVFDEMPIKGLRYLSQSTDSLNRTNQVTESMESLTDEGQ